MLNVLGQLSVNRPSGARPHTVIFALSLAVFCILITIGLLYRPADARQRNDIVELADFLQQAYEENTGTVSVTNGHKAKELYVCTNNCSHINYIATLEYYTNKNVSFQNYAAGLAVPDSAQAYIVDNVGCNDTFTGLGAYGVTANGNPAQAILYATARNNTLVQHCFNVFGPDPSNH